MIATYEAKEELRKKQQGFGKPIISIEHHGYRFTAVGNQLLYSTSHKTFIDFLADYIRNVLGEDWGNAEIAKPFEERHPILQWHDSICQLQQENMSKPKGEVQEMPVTGVVIAYYGLAYNLYLLKHNVDLQKFLIDRLKKSDSFHSAYYETFVAAWFILAGFELKLENEKDPTRTHPEFVATRDGKSYSVEAKMRQSGKGHLDIGNQLYKALSIDSSHERIVFVDINVGPDIDPENIRQEVSAAVRGREDTLSIQGVPAPPAYVFITNQPYHLALHETDLPRICLLLGFKKDDFGDGVRFSSYTEAYKSRLKYAALMEVQAAMANYKLPITFDGELPEFAFGDAKRRFVIGEKLEVEKGSFMILESGVVSVSEKTACLVMLDKNDQRHIMTVQLTDAEVAAYKGHPETFFGRIRPVAKDVQDPLDMYAFFLNGYKDTPRDKLLKLMEGASDIEELKKLPEDELRYTYAERLTWQVVNQSKKNQEKRSKD